MIIDEIEFEPSFDAAHIGVAVENGIVTLTGHVKSFVEKVAAETAVKRVKGVKGIAQEIEVRYPDSHKTSDDEIAKRAVNFIDWSTSLPKDRIKVSVQHGYVTLSGEVDWNYQKQLAENGIRSLKGVVGVLNTITLKMKPQPADVQKQIENALKRNAELEANQIRVSVLDGKVTLEGKVKAWYEREIAENAAWAAPGVRVVDDRIRIA
jgi:osmotically-inducible protein OsmY